MSLYKKIGEIGSKYIGKNKMFKYGFNFSPMYRRSTGRITTVSKDLMNIQIKLPISYKNRNYVNSIFGGSLFSSVDPIPMVQLMAYPFLAVYLYFSEAYFLPAFNGIFVSAR